MTGSHYQNAPLCSHKTVKLDPLRVNRNPPHVRDGGVLTMGHRLLPVRLQEMDSQTGAWELPTGENQVRELPETRLVCLPDTEKQT